ncbi:uncharacterized protein LOC118439166 [Folsomia candida]|uniref:uncharacterized protein LOC118439166 n=1 Tax=Folsomia candida TaxID=158441 RepID=UPI001604E730|nr:uncharacterized protein LOC118439166 [Folsomia candida]
MVGLLTDVLPIAFGLFLGSKIADYLVDVYQNKETFLDKARQTEILAARMAELISGMNLTSPSIEITAYGGGKEKSVADFFWTRFSDRYDFPQKLESMGPLAIKIRIFPQLSSFNKAEIGIRVMIDGHAVIVEASRYRQPWAPLTRPIYGAITSETSAFLDPKRNILVATKIYEY